MTCPSCRIENPPSVQHCDCGHEFESGGTPKESSTPSQKKKTSPALIVCFGLLAIAVLIVVISSGNPNSPSLSAGGTSSSTASASTLPEHPVSQTKPEPGPQWRYSTDEDTMGRKRSFALLTSTNTLSFGFPYQGSQHGTLIVRKSGGTSVMLSIEKGQFLCGIDECTVNVRFDSGPIRRFSASGPDDHSTTVLFLRNVSALISQMRKAKTVRIEATFYQEGSETLEFNVDGFKWE